MIILLMISSSKKFTLFIQSKKYFSDMVKEVEEKEHAYFDASQYFSKCEQFYESNKKFWKDSKEYDKIRNARWDKDEARKEQTRRKKDLAATKAKAGPHHTIVNYNSSEGNLLLKNSEIIKKN